jgi:hypothetical protein
MTIPDFTGGVDDDRSIAAQRLSGDDVGGGFGG